MPREKYLTVYWEPAKIREFLDGHSVKAVFNLTKDSSSPPPGNKISVTGFDTNGYIVNTWPLKRQGAGNQADLENNYPMALYWLKAEQVAEYSTVGTKPLYFVPKESGIQKYVSYDIYDDDPGSGVQPLVPLSAMNPCPPYVSGL